MKIVTSNLYGLLNESMDQAKSILNKLHIPLNDERFQQLKKTLLDDNKIGYIGKFTKWLFQDHESWERVMEVYNMLKTHRSQVPPIHTFDKLENLFDFLQGSSIDVKVNQVVNSIPSQARKLVTPELKKLIELNIQWAKVLSDFYSKKGGKFKNSKDLYNETEGLITNLEGDFNLEATKQKIKKSKHPVEIMLETPEVMIIRPLSYEASCEFGSKSWCISYSKNYWDQYADLFSNQYFIYDFTKPISDKRAKIGVTVNPDASFKAAHFSDDSVCPHEYLKTI